jgi:arginine decarboxylase
LMKRQIDQAIRKDLVKPREGIRLLEQYESLLAERTYLNVRYEKPARTEKRKPRKKKRASRK